MKLAAFILSAIGFATVSTANAQISIEKKKPGAQYVLACSDEAPSLGFVVRELTDEPEIIVTELFLFQGTKNIPVDAYPRANDLQALQKRASLLSLLPTYVRLEWPRSQCSDKGPYVLSCTGATAITGYNGAQIKGLAMETILSAEISTAGESHSVRVNLNLSINDEPVTVPLYYKGPNCTSDYIF